MADKKEMTSVASSSNSGVAAGAGNNRGESVVMDCGRRRSSCGYCKSGSRSSISHGLWANSLTVDDYQALLDRGWRRSGCFLYKPEMESTCCPSYTIRLKAGAFVPTKEQRRVLKRMERFLEGLSNKQPEELTDAQTTSKTLGSSSCKESSIAGSKEYLPIYHEENNHSEQFIRYFSEQIDNAVQTCAERGEISSDVQLPKASIKEVAPAKRKLLVEGAEDLLFTSNISFQIVAVLRRSKKDHRDSSKDGVPANLQSAQLTPNDVAQKLANCLNQVAVSSGFAIKACNGHINFYSSGKQLNPGNVPGRDKALVQSCTKKRGSTMSSGNIEVKRRKLEIRLKRSSFDPEEYSLYRRYQIRVHNDEPDDVSESSYNRFLVDTPLAYVPPTAGDGVPPCGFGSFHQQYLIDGKLVAVGVVDILPKCLSSKYLFWDPDLAFLSLGKYSALQEIRWVRENELHCPSLQYYYMGYYIHSCNKMRYKAAYSPSELLCPLRYTWVPFEIAKPLLDRKPYVVLSDFTTQNGGSLPSSVPDSYVEEQPDDHAPGGSNDIFVHADEDMTEYDSEDCDGEEDTVPSGNMSDDLEDGDVGNVLIGLTRVRLRFKDVQHAFDPRDRQHVTTQLQRYMRAVGRELSGQMVYSLS
ncbi:arginyl-tRNA--protein transferase 2-like [Ipomoea triloba]|uniref:arginyl-tRNA--protein transferase 2-like n=1 Tax=Ipomoea triloba TaxID=35885 RepID=UPI00125DD07B|nr:arginyl-tRNA--protein transferase 2-like [Ipomoea triloba]